MHDRTPHDEASAERNADLSNRDADLQSVGLKSTLPRKRVLELLRDPQSRHLSAEGIYRRLLDLGTDVGLGTVYRVLSQLESAGLLLRNDFDGGKAIYELNDGDHHDHLICLGCGQVDEFSNEAIEVLQKQTAQAHGYRLVDHRLALYGYCQNCQDADPTGSGATARN